MLNFDFQNATKIIFGTGTVVRVGDETAIFSKKVLLHYGSQRLKNTGLFDEVATSLTKAGVDFIELGGVKPNPRLSLVHEGIKICKDNDIDFIIAVGGGSVIDSAKAIALGAVYDGDVWDFYLKKAEPIKALGLGVVLTIAAAGSEASVGSVISKEDGQYKRAVNNEMLRPKFSILAPELTLSLPAYQTACGGTDIIAHVMERYFTTVNNVCITDRLCEAVLKTMISNLPIAIDSPDNINARAEIMWAGTIAHNDLLSTGRIGDWSSHDIEHELSAIYDIAHGAGLAIIFPAWMKYVYKSDINRFAQFANRVFNCEIRFDDIQLTALEGIKRFENFLLSIGLPTRLSQIGIGHENFEIMAEKAVMFGELGNFVKLNKDDIVKIYELAL